MVNSIFKTYEVTVDTMRDSIVPQNMRYSQNDLKSAKILININHNGNEEDFSEATAVRVSFEKGDKKIVYQDCQPINVLEGKYQVLLTTQTLTSVGIVTANVHIYFPDDKKIETGSFKFEVVESKMSDEVIESTDSLPVIQKAIEAGEKLSGVDIPALVASKETAEQAKVAAEQNAAQIGILSKNVDSKLAENAKYAIDQIHHLKPNKLNLTDSETTGIRLREMGKDGVVYGIDGATIKKYDDLTNTWSTVLTAPLPPNVILSLDNGELLFTTFPNDGINKSTVYVTENGQKSFKEVFQSSNVGNCYFHNNWGKSTHGNIVVLSEYGTRGIAIGVYLSTDYGKTFKMVFNIRDYGPVPNNAHVHGSRYDPYWNRIWVVNGDLENSSLFWSDDLGVTWKTTGNPFNQLLNIMPMKNCVLFGADSVPYAIYRMDREDKNMTPKLKIAHIYSEDTVGHLSYLPKAFHQRDENSPVIINFCPENPDMVSTYPNVWALATYDGINYYEIFRDTITKIDDISMLAYLPTKNNKAVVTTSKGKVLIGNAPVWEKGDFAYQTPYEVTSKSIDDIFVSARDFGVRSVNEDPFNYGNTKALTHALKYCADNHKILHIPKDMEVTVGDILIENKSNFGIRVDGKLKAKAVAGLKGIVFKNCSNIRIFDVNATYETYGTPYRDTQSILRFEQCNEIYFDRLICDNVHSNVVDFVGCKGIYGKMVKGTGKPGGSGANLIRMIDCENSYIDDVIGEDIGTDSYVGGVLITTSSNTAVVRNINFKNIVINNHSTRSVSLDNTKLGTMEDITLGNVKLTKKETTAATIYPVYLAECKNINGDITVKGTSDGVSALYINNVEGLRTKLDINKVKTGIFQIGYLSKSKITGKIDNCTYRAMSLEDMSDTEFEVETGEVTGSQYSVVISYSKTRNNVLFDKCKFRKGANVTGAVDIGGTNTGVLFKDCDLTEWGTDLLKMIKCGSTASIKREGCLGMNYLTAPPATGMGKWNVGEVVWNSAPAAGGYMGWICTVAGTPGTWKGFGLIQA
ncbi:BppU family phage baseplate upper protein [Bacillus paranthracis]|nr:BppU family phage baseplate upper protein [Bacillus paranthracis]MCC2358872.1 BppU family phage baseplate upper protein [Bacillus paranthracis]MDG0911947.1 BppU family phage baseplate upper protein [Bacillus paranthracis]MDR4349772.1 DUF2479 domain-containing protein [Bacillus paranthracis]HDR4702404.1 BppU family phage baseplate upper protein [Bacillus paranthracis]HDR7458810.1 BppU family phage baseplate upper protein [Bacillus paranthracis]